MDPKIKRILFLLAIGLTISQAISVNRITYPFVSWPMYGSATPHSSYIEYLMVSEAGETEHYPFTIIAFSSPRAFMENVRRLIDQCKCDRNDSRVDELIRGLQKVYTEETSHSFQKMEINRVVFNPNDSKDQVRQRIYNWVTKKDSVSTSIQK